MSTRDKLIKARGEIPRKKVCEDVGIAGSTLRMYELGLRTPRDDIKIKLSAYYGIPVGDLFY